jgi:hypothetical protein
MKRNRRHQNANTFAGAIEFMTRRWYFLDEIRSEDLISLLSKK